MAKIPGQRYRDPDVATQKNFRLHPAFWRHLDAIAKGWDCSEHEVLRNMLYRAHPMKPPPALRRWEKDIERPGYVLPEEWEDFDPDALFRDEQ